MLKRKYTSELLNPKAILVMVKTSNLFKERAEKYEELNNKTTCDSSEKRKKVILKDFISKEISSYKKDSKMWILTNGPTGAGKKELTEKEIQKQTVEVV